MSRPGFFVIKWQPLNNPALLPVQANRPPDAFFNVRWRPGLSLAYYPAMAVPTQLKMASPTD